MFLRLLRIRNTFLPKISLKLNILEMRKFVLTMRIAIIILLHKKSYSQKDLAYYNNKSLRVYSQVISEATSLKLLVLPRRSGYLTQNQTIPIKQIR